jgi:hypothetical protein
MHRGNATLFGLPAACWAVIFLGGCGIKTSKSYAPEVDPAAAGKAALAQYDANKDGKISGAELDKVASLKSNLEKIDLNNDKALTAEEIADRIRSWQTDKLLGSRSPINVRVFHNRKPLVGAEVKLVPEKFLGETMKTIQGTTGPTGTATLLIKGPAPEDPPGVGPGFYRVEITKPGERIPAIYNTKTTLGLDTSIDNPTLGEGALFILKY